METDATTTSRQLKHEWLASHLRRQIRSGALRAGDAIETEAQLCRRYQLSRGPVRQALAGLEQEGLIFRVQGKGTFVSEVDAHFANKKPRITVLFDYHGALDDNVIVMSMIDELNHGAKAVMPGCEISFRFHRFTSPVPSEIAQLFTTSTHDGLLVVPFTDAGVEYLSTLRNVSVPFATCFDRVTTQVPHQHQFYIDHEYGAYQATEFLVRYGHERIAMVTSRFVSPGPAQRERHEGYARVLREAGLPYDPDLTVAYEPYALNFEAVMKRLFNQAEPPTAMVIGGVKMIRDTIRALKAIEVRIPEDVSIITIDDPPANRQMSPPLSAVRQPMSENVGQALATLVREIVEPGSGPVVQSFRPELVLRGSCQAHRPLGGV